MDGLELLISQHDMVNNLFRQFEQGGNSQEFGLLFNQLNQALNLHALIEEEVLYPMMKNFPETANLAQENFVQHAKVKETLTRIAGLDNTSTEWGQMMTSLMRDVQQHVQIEEGTEFPKLRQLLGQQQLQQLGQQLQTAMNKGLTAQTLNEATQMNASQMQPMGGMTTMQQPMSSMQPTTDTLMQNNTDQSNFAS